MRKFNHTMAAYALASSLLLVLAGCGGGGGGGSDDMMTGGGTTPTTCPTGQTGTPPNCVTPPPPGMSPADRTAAMRIAGMIGPNATLADNDGSESSEADNIVTGIGTDNMAAFAGQTPTSTNKFAKSATMPAAISGWMGTGTHGTYTRTNDNKMHTVVLYNDRAANTSAVYFDSEGTGLAKNYFGTEAGRTASGVNSISSDGTTRGVLTLDTNVTGHHGLFSTNFGVSSNSTLTLTIPAGSTTFTQAGSFAGVPGTFTCPAAPCKATADKDGNLTMLTSGDSGMWTFTPDAVRNITEDAARIAALKAIMVPGVIPDPDFLMFGYWEEVTSGTNPTDRMRPFAYGKRNSGSLTGITSAAEATASYAGKATGLYMSKTLNPDGSVNQAGPWASGQFTADAMLMAKFGGTSVAGDDQWSVTGTISNFMAGGTAINSNWVLSLNRKNLGTAAAPNYQQNIGVNSHTSTEDGGGGSGEFVGRTHGGTLHSMGGYWSGRFHGDPTVSDKAPTSASGIFDGHFTNGHVRGGFGVNKTRN